MNKFRLGFCILGVLSLLVFSGCTTAVRVASNGLEKQAATSQVIVALSKQELGTDIKSSNVTAAMGGGLLGAVIDTSIEHSRAKKAESAVVPMRNALLGYDVGQVFTQCLQQELGQEEWVKNASFEIKTEADLGSAEKLALKISADALVAIHTDYHMTPGFDCLELVVDLAIHPHAQNLVAQTVAKNEGFTSNKEALYYNQFRVRVVSLRSPAVLKPKPADWVAFWAAADGKMIRGALDRGLAMMAKMIAFDIKQPGTLDQDFYGTRDTSEVRQVMLPNGVTSRGFVVNREAGFEWVRLAAGQLTTVIN